MRNKKHNTLYNSKMNLMRTVGELPFGNSFVQIGESFVDDKEIVVKVKATRTSIEPGREFLCIYSNSNNPQILECETLN